MKINMQALLRDNGVRLADSHDKHVTKGWVNMRCPFCGDDSFHLGWDLGGQKFHCWKCGGHRRDETISELLTISEAEAWRLCRQYELRAAAMLDELESGKERVFVRPAQITVPGVPLSAAEARQHHRYLEGRNYDPLLLERTWGLTAVGHLGSYKFRVICPVWHDGRIVGFQGRDITGRAALRWLSPPDHLWTTSRNDCLGGMQHATGDTCVVVEGASSAWRLGPGAVWTQGTAFSTAQVNLLRRFRRRFVMLDSAAKDPNAGRRARQLAAMLAAFGGETRLVELDSGDPGDLPQAEADALMRDWGFQNESR